MDHSQRSGLLAYGWGLCFLFLIFWGMSSVPAYGLKCDLCRKTLRSEYYAFRSGGEKVLVCPDCETNCKKCELCRIPLRKHEVRHVGGASLCRACAKKALVCDECNDLIEGKFYRVPETGEVLCTKCYGTLPRCARCIRPLSGQEAGRLLMVDNERICSRCWEEAPRCAGCEKPILGSMFTYKHSDLVFCAECEGTTGKCYCCGLPLGTQGIELVDGRKICVRCQQEAVLEQRHLESVWKRVRHYLSRKGFPVNHALKVKVVDRNRLRGIMRAPHGSHEMGAFEAKGDTFTIYVLNALPESLLFETLAHEYAHAWQMENCPKNQDKMLCEGFAEWLSSLLLQARGLTLQLQKMQDRTDVYGQGYRKLKEIERRHGRRYVVDFVKKSKQFH